MKKIIFSIAAAAMAMAACTQTDVVYEDSAQIGLSPVNYNATKTVYGAVEGKDYPVDESFGVFAQHTSSGAGTWLAGDNGTLQPYLVDAKFSHDTGAGESAWTGDPDPYYWPRTGSLYFAGYSPYEITGTVSYDFATEHHQNMNIDGFVQGNYAWADGTTVNPDNKMVDLMWFDALTSANTGLYPATFNHALTYLTFKFNAEVDDLFEVKSVTLENVYNTGDFDSNNGYPSWAVSGTPSALGLYNWGQVLKTGETYLTIDDVLVIPQKTAYINIVYTQKAGTGTPAIEMLYRAQLTGGEAANDASVQWMIGKHYTYYITIGAEEIRIQPDVKEWTNVNKQINVEQ